MTENIRLSGEQGKSVDINHHPDCCPICHNSIIPNIKYLMICGRRSENDLRIIYECPNSNCEEIFIAYFYRYNDEYQLRELQPSRPTQTTFSDPIREISQSFCNIFGESHIAEELGLTQICGVGYRKALEFLIKDYLIRERPTDQSAIESAMLGQCIENYVTDPRTKQVAKRAVWLGNDETHYKRRWVDKDLRDLKILINLVVHWIEAEHLTAEALRSMP